MYENQKINDTLDVALGRAKDLVNGAGLVGYGVVSVIGPDGEVKQCEPFANIVTTAGDKYYAQSAVYGAGGSAPSPGAAIGMRLGTSSTAASKSTQDTACIGSSNYISGSYRAFDSTPTAAAKAGTDTGWEVTYVTTWPSNGVTNATINEVAIVNTATDTGAASAVLANTYSRAVITTVNKATGDTLAVTWKHLFLGA